jgi:HSP20 family protein
MFSLTPWKKKEMSQATESGRGDVPLAQMRDEFETLFNRFFGNLPVAGEGWDFEHGWALDVDESDRDITVRAEAPGFEAKDFEVEMSGKVLYIHAETKKEEKKAEKDKGDFSESRYARFERIVPLPEHIERDKVEANYRNGVLEVRVPKTAEAQAKRIEVKG